MTPRDVPFILHEGVRYDAPHFYQPEQVLAPELSTRDRAMQVLHKAGSADPAGLMNDPARCHQVLSQAGFNSDEITQVESYLESERVLRRVITQSLQELIFKSMSQGGPPNPMAAISPEWLLEALEKEGTLSPEQRQDAVVRWQNSQQALKRGLESMGGQNGGWLLASNPLDGSVLWSLRVYDPIASEDVFITSLEMDGEHLLVRDEKRREHRVDLKLRRLV